MIHTPLIICYSITKASALFQRLKQIANAKNKMDNFLDFKDKVVILTGASSGIGAETARILSSYDAKLTIVGRNAERLKKVAQECEEKKGMPPLQILVDLTYPGSCETVVHKTVARYGKIDVLINCAGNFSLSSVFDESINSFDDIMGINLKVPYHLTQLTIPHLVKTKGNIINISFSMTNKYRPGLLVSNMAKSALERFTIQAAAELATEGVRINTVTPGITRTNILSSLDIDDPTQQYVYDWISSILPCGKVLDPKEVALYICVVASDVFKNMTGASLVIDGASSLVS
ncbi:unnamed protein product [Diatraea saccharalis]|uniref:Uncharacterized protein n=1 Tax=Diatraea saccharalis TaxID=40085 RepID=A0A9N9R644_9NEOP|nr:unnamed protein product [Diatraea saccharalis]